MGALDGYKNTNRKLTDITDGTSNTAMIGESAGKPDYYAAGKLQPGVASFRPYYHTAWISWNAAAIRSWSTDGLTQHGPCIINCTNADGGLYSFHTSGVNMVFADGSVHHIRATTNKLVVYALVSKSMGEVA